MKNKKLTVTIGIPAYNEEANIRLLLGDIFKQKILSGILEKILIISDGSTDRTVEKVEQINNNKIVFIKNKNRQGLAKIQEEIATKSDSDILVLLQGDIRLSDDFLIEKLIQPIFKNNADLVVPDVIEIEPKTFFEKILYVSTKIKNVAYRDYNNGDNVYTCRGLARAFSKRLYKDINFDSSIGEDAFSYFYCVSNGFKYIFTKDAKILFRLPANFSDHKKQSLRFFRSQELLKAEFGDQMVSKSYSLPKSILVKALIKNFFFYPVYVISYIAILAYLKGGSLLKVNIKDTWDISVSSKKN